MADDLDELLDEVEAKFCRNISLPQQRKQEDQPGDHQQDKTKSKTKQVEGTRRDDSDDIDALLDEILDDDDNKSSPAISNSKKVTRSGMDHSATQVVKRKCCPVFVGGSTTPHGIGTSNSKRACDQLRCISCDFRIASFDDYEWDSTCDYLFFRNNMPDCQRLRAKLRRCKGARAYACQCSWHTALALGDLAGQTQAQLRWVCGAHDT
ncbi:cilia- and flagella-associated protein 418 isoform X2 [Engraulis encrasicolus]|uniref:cilia- and flagella-associated protein 418 isoform X2 n=1 Tax=Engraulis encrasicolus TaxID=184585 RepID=UPI002FD285EC